MQAQLNWLDIGQVAATRLAIPIYTIGTGRPRFAVTSSVHGDEHAGLYMAARVLDRIRSITKLSGTIHVISAANPPAQFLGSRVGPLDQKDLNRLGRGRPNGTLTERVASRLFDFLSECDFIVNIHEFEMRTPTTAVLVSAGDINTRTRTLEAILVFRPDIIWVIDQSQAADMQYGATLDATLALAGVANFAVETTQLAFLSEREILRVARGIIRVAAHVGMVSGPHKKSPSRVPAFTREEVTADVAGLWEPSHELMRQIELGERVGTLITLPDFQSQPVVSPSAGILLQRRHRQLVSTGTSLYSVGHPADHIVTNYLLS